MATMQQRRGSIPQSVRRLRRRMRAARRWTVFAGLSGGASAVLIPLGGVAAWDAVWAAMFGGSTIMAIFRWSDYRRVSKLVSAENERLAQHGGTTLAFEAQTIFSAIAGKMRRGRMSARYRNSAAGPAFGRLERAAQAFDDLAGGMHHSATDVLDDVHSSQRVLVDLAGQVRAVEKSMEVASPQRRESLARTHRLMVERLEDGVSAYEETVGAAAQVVAEKGALESVVSAGSDPTMARLSEATAKLHGLAEGIGEMRKLHDGFDPPA